MAAAGKRVGKHEARELGAAAYRVKPASREVNLSPLPAKLLQGMPWAFFAFAS